ncbi:MAG: hypothetical protein HYZ42_10905 [Bacteroidetes bacterium]|nr:hypothetical protein [Bacteroidota bacterium]
MMLDGTLTGIKVALGPSLILTGFGGGVANHMNRQTDPNAAPAMPSGLTYLPDSTLNLSFKASVFFVAPTKDVCNGNLTFEMKFNEHGGVEMIGLYGVGNFLDVSSINGDLANIRSDLKESIEKVSDTSSGNFIQKSIKIKNLSNTSNVPDGIKLQVAMEYNFTNKSFLASAQVYMRLAQGFVVGSGSNNQAGSFELYVDPNTWHVYLGTLSNRNGIKVGIGNINATYQNYFMVGNDISPQSPALPMIVTSMLGDQVGEIDMVRAVDKIEKGSAICFGVSASVSTGNINCSILYGSFEAGIGFDVMLKKYGKGAHCEGSNAAFGFHDWYMMGRAYAYVEAEIGISIKGHDYRILQGAAGVILQTRTPNPSWFKGTVCGEYDILNGLYHDNFVFSIEFGTYCNIEYGKPSISEMEAGSLQVIESISPMNQEEDVDVYARPIVYFNSELNKINEFEDGRGVIKYKFKIQEFTLRYGTNKDSVVAGSYVMASDNKKAYFNVTEYLPEDHNVLATVRVGMYEIKGENEVLMMSEGKPISDTFMVEFKTGFLPQKIAMNNLAACYPVPNQKYLYLSEDSAAYVNLKRAQNWVMLDTSVYVFIYTAGEDTLVRTATMKGNKMGLDYYLPQGLKNLTNYNVKLIRVGQTVYDANKAVGDYLVDETIPQLMDYNFSTSRYNTFGQKLKAIQFANANIERLEENSDVLILGAEIQNSEPFDYIEMTTDAGSGYKMIYAVAKVDSEYYFTDSISPLIYPDSTLNNLTPGSAEYRYKVLQNIKPLESYMNEAQSGVSSTYTETTFPYTYNLVSAYKQQYIDVRYEIVNRYIGSADLANYERLVNGSFPAMPAKTYQTFLQYRLPNGTVGTSGVFVYRNELY